MKYLVLSLCLLTGRFAYSQDAFPKLVVIKGDTCALLTIKQVKDINIAFARYEQDAHVLLSFKYQNGIYRSLIKAKDEKIDNMIAQKTVSDSLFSLSHIQTETERGVNLHLERQIKLLKIERDILCAAVLVASGWIAANNVK